jgi:hypothetical protein
VYKNNSIHNLPKSPYKKRPYFREFPRMTNGPKNAGLWGRFFIPFIGGYF